MHPKNDHLRAFLDRELSEEENHQIHQHLSGCQQCQKSLQTIEARARTVAGQIDTVAPRSTEIPAVPLVYSRFTSRRRPAGFVKEVFSTMFTRRSVWITLAVLAVVVVAFSFSPVRVWASDFLSLFRLQQVEVITFDPEQVEAVKQRMEENESAIRAIFKENVQFQSEGKIQPVESDGEAQDLAGFDPRLPASWGDRQLAVRPSMKAMLTIDQPEFQALIDAMGVDYEISPDLDGETVTVYAPAAVIAAHGCDASEFNEHMPRPDCPVLVQLPSPEIDAPSGFDTQEIGEALLRLLGMSEMEASLISQRIDWTTTLILPLPQSGEVTYQEVDVDGVTGTLLQEAGEESYTLVWIKEGMLYGLYAPGDSSDAVRIANSLQ